MKTFWEFVGERENIRIRKENGDLQPWTDDEVLRVNHFTNVDRNHDRGTKLLFEKIKDLKANLKMFWTMVYRLSGSNPGILDGDLTKYDVIIPEKKPTFSAKAYSLPCFPKGTGIAMRFIKEWLPENFNAILTVASSWDNASIDEVATDLYETISKMTGYPKMRFHMGEIAKDLSVLFPSKINPDSKVNLGPGCKKGLRKIGVKANDKGMCDLIYAVENKGFNLNFSSIEHAACEYGKYVDIHKAGQHRNRVRDINFKKKIFKGE